MNHSHRVNPDPSQEIIEGFWHIAIVHDPMNIFGILDQRPTYYEGYRGFVYNGDEDDDSDDDDSDDNDDDDDNPNQHRTSSAIVLGETRFKEDPKYYADRQGKNKIALPRPHNHLNPTRYGHVCFAWLYLHLKKMMMVFNDLRLGMA